MNMEKPRRSTLSESTKDALSELAQSVEEYLKVEFSTEQDGAKREEGKDDHS